MLPSPKVGKLAVYRCSSFKLQVRHQDEQKDIQGDRKVLTMCIDQSHRATRKI